MFKELNILKLFFEEPTKEFNVREVARLVKVSPATASKELKKLVKIMLLKERKEKIFNWYKSNLESEDYRDLKIYYTIRKIKESGLIGSLNTFYLRPALMLFGSCAYGIDIETSDIDLLIVSEKIKEFPDIKIYEKKLHRRIQLFPVKDIKDVRNEHLINNILNGIILQGKIKWI